MGRLRRLRLQPPHDPGTGIRERVDASDARPGDVARHEVVSLAVELRVDLAIEDQVGLLVRVVVAPRAYEVAGDETDLVPGNAALLS